MKNLKRNSRLANLTNDDSMTTEDVTELLENMRKRDAVKEIVDLTKIREREDIHQFYVYIKRKQFTGNSYNDLINNIHNAFFANKDTLSSLYPQMMIYKRDVCQSSQKTLKEYSFRWNNIKKLDIVNRPIQELEPNDFIVALRELVNQKKLTESAFRDHKSVINFIYAYAIEKGIVKSNPLRDLNFKQLRFRVSYSETEILTPEQRLILLNHLSRISDDVYALAIMLDLCMLSRIAEIKALKWSDVAENHLKIHHQIVEHQEMKDNLTFATTEKKELSHIKGYKKEGIRNMPLIPTAKEVLAKAKTINPNSEYIFLYENRPLTTITFNRHLEKYCKECCIPTISSHEIRFSVASAMYAAGVSLPELQTLLGHTNLNTTMRYLKNTKTLEQTALSMCAIL